MTHFQHWIAAWIDMIVGLLGVITFGLYRPWWDFTYRCWATKKGLKREPL